MSRDDMEDGGFPEGFVNAMLNRGQTPEDLLYQMRVDKEKEACLNLEKTKKRQLALQLATLDKAG
jgi:hypothetical protein